MNARASIQIAVLVLAAGLGLAAAAVPEGDSTGASIRHGTVVREVLYGRGKEKRTPVKRRLDVVFLENRYLQVTVCPALGERVLNVVDKIAGRKLFREGVLRYSGSALDEGGGSGGGIQVNHPYYHAGSSYVNRLPYQTAVLKDGTAELAMAYTSYPHLQRTVWRIRLRPDEAAFRFAYRFENLSPYPMGFNPWISAAFAIRQDLQFVLPTKGIADHWFGINADARWGNRIDPWPVGADGKDQSYLANRKWKTAFGYGITEGHAGLYYHDSDEGFVHVFDPAKMPAAKIGGAWRTDGQGWCEVWGGFSHNMEDPLWLAPHETVGAADAWFPVRGIHGLTWADENAAVNLQKADDQIHCGVYTPRNRGRGALRLTADGRPLIQASVELGPRTPFFRTVACPRNTDEVRLTVLDADGRVVIERRRFFAPRPRQQFVLPEKPWHQRTTLTKARWEEAFTPTMAWGPWYYPPKTYAEAIAAEPDNVEALLGRARALMKDAAPNLFRSSRKTTDEAKLKEAAQILEALAGRQPPPARALYLLGRLRLGQADGKGARALFQRLLGGGGGETGPGRYHLALLAAAAANWDESVAHAKRAVALSPDSTLARQLLAVGLLEQGHAREAGEALAAVIQANPAAIGAIELRRRCAAALGREAEVREAVRQLALLQQRGPRQYAAGMAQLAALEAGRDLDCRQIDTIRGAETIGQEP